MNSEQKPGVSIRAYARHRGCALNAVQKAIQSGRISRNPDGTIDAARADEEWARNTFSTASLSNLTGRPARIAPLAEEDAGVKAPPVNAGSDPLQAYLKARAVKETFLAKRAQAEYELFNGKLMETEKAGSYAATFSSLVKEHLLAMPERLASSLAAVDDEHAVLRILVADVHTVLKKLNKAIQDAGF